MTKDVAARGDGVVALAIADAVDSVAVAWKRWRTAEPVQQEPLAPRPPATVDALLTGLDPFTSARR
ncbi:hypothetical protein ACFQZZ_21900 [Nocardia sp. GCM10030253]|uniref:hypothetical protein n=1 Tax=Nocardia sp. GCM10030253 TaxID=3273404 RepID=UPI003639E201